MAESEEPVVVEFPLRGEWTTPNTPGRRVPSHGTDLLGQRYAYDFVRVDPSKKGMRFYNAGIARYLTVGVRLEDCYGWGQPIHSPVAGICVEAGDGWPERRTLQPLKDVAAALGKGLTVNIKKLADLRSLAGNYVIIETSSGYAFLAHARPGSLEVAKGDRVEVGDRIANVGHSGNSTAPHLHFQMMDRQDPREARGVPCCFREYEVFVDDAWVTVRNGIPKHTDRLRWAG